jgi:RNA polymerase sigma factor (sigma-70 family)
MSLLRSRPELLDRFRAGERGALGEIYRAYLPRLRQLIRRGFMARQTGTRVPGASNPDDLADILQEVFTRAFKREARIAYDGERDFWPYLAVIARNVVVSRHRRSGREVLGLESAAASEQDLVEAPDEPSPWHDPRSLAIVQAYIATLEEPMRAVHTARYVEALSQRDAAEKLGLSRPKVRKVEAKLRHGLLNLLVQAGLHVSVKFARTGDEQGEWITRPRTN